MLPYHRTTKFRVLRPETSNHNIQLPVKYYQSTLLHKKALLIEPLTLIEALLVLGDIRLWKTMGHNSD